MQGQVLNNSLYVTFRFDNNLITIVLEGSGASEVEPAAVVAPLQSRSQAANEKSQQNVEEEEPSTSNGEMGQAVSNESPDYMTGILKGTSSSVLIVITKIGREDE